MPRDGIYSQLHSVLVQRRGSKSVELRFGAKRNYSDASDISSC